MLGTNKLIKSKLAIGEHLLNNLECSKNYNYKMFSIACKGRNMYHLSVIESFL